MKTFLTFTDSPQPILGVGGAMGCCISSKFRGKIQELMNILTSARFQTTVSLDPAADRGPQPVFFAQGPEFRRRRPDQYF